MGGSAIGVGLALFALSCGARRSDRELSDGSDGDADTDSDGDSDADTDGDTDADTDGCEPSDEGTGPTFSYECDCVDEDSDGFAARQCGGDDCNDADATSTPETVAAGWPREVVDASGASESAAAIDAAGDLHVAYGAGDELRHGFLVDDVWTTERVDSLAGSVSIAVEAGGRVHVAYLDADAALRHAARDDAWTIETVEDPDVAEGPSLALDAGGAAHLAYYVDGEVHWASNASGAWIAERVAAADPGRAPVDTAIATRSDGTPAVAFFDAGGLELDYATRGAAGWDRSIVDPNAGARGDVSLIHVADVAHVVEPFCCAGAGFGSLRHHAREGAEWTFEVFALGPSFLGTRTSLAADADGALHVGFQQADGVDCGYGPAWATNADGAWAIEAIDTTSLPLGAASIAAASGALHAFYATDDGLLHARREWPGG